jgi:hypothetical protein
MTWNDLPLSGRELESLIRNSGLKIERKRSIGKGIVVDANQRRPCRISKQSMPLEKSGEILSLDLPF